MKKLRDENVGEQVLWLYFHYCRFYYHIFYYKRNENFHWLFSTLQIPQTCIHCSRVRLYCVYQRRSERLLQDFRIEYVQYSTRYASFWELWGIVVVTSFIPSIS